MGFFENPFKKKMDKEKLAGAAAITAAVAAGVGNAIPIVDDFQRYYGDKPEAVRNVTPQELGTRPDLSADTVTLNMAQKIVEMRAPGDAEPVSIDLSPSPPTSVDLSVPVTSMEPPTDPHPERQ